MLPRRVTILLRTRRIRPVLSSAAASLVVAGTVLFAQSPVQEQLVGRRLAAPAIAERIETRPIEDEDGASGGAQATHTSRIMGVVINEQGVALPRSGTLILRSVQTGRAVAQNMVDEFGHFNFPSIDPGMYAAELVNASGGVLTSTPAFSVNAGEVLQLTPVLSQSSTGALAQFLKSGTAAAISAAVGAGILTLAPLPGASPE